MICDILLHSLNEPIRAVHLQTSSIERTSVHLTGKRAPRNSWMEMNVHARRFCQNARKLFPSASEFFLGDDQRAAQLPVLLTLLENAAVMRNNLADRLVILQAYDHFRDWRAVDDERVCVLCD